VSSILEALKKLEQEKDDKDQDFDWPHPVDTKGAFYHRLKGGSPYKAVLIGFFLCLTIGVSLFVFSREPELQHHDDMVSTSHDEKVKADDRAARARMARRTPPPDQTRNVTEVHDQRPVTPMVQEQPEPEQTIADEARPEDMTPEEMAQDEEYMADMEALEDIMAPRTVKAIPDKSVQPALEIPAMEDKAQEEAVAELDPEMAELLKRIPPEMLPPKKMVESGWLKLHAISWSEDPERRIAVINAKVVKEGRRLDGALILRIERDYVVIKKNGEELMLPFGNH